MRCARGLSVGLLLTMLGCAPVGDPTLPPSTGPSSAATPGPTVTAVPTPTPTPVIVPATPAGTVQPAPKLAWQRLDTSGLAFTQMTAAFEVAGAYVLVGWRDDLRYEVARSLDGKVWSTTTIDEMIGRCGSTGAESAVQAAAAAGSRAILVGHQQAPNGPCGDFEAVAWATDGGLSWRRSEGFGSSSAGLASAVWPIPGGWEALVKSGLDGPTDTWGTALGTQWQRVARVAPAFSDGLEVAIGGAPDGRRLLALYNGQGPEDVLAGLCAGEARLQVSSDGVSWQDVGVPWPSGRGVIRIVPPLPDRAPAWLLVTSGGDESLQTSVSPDLVDWKHAAFPRNRIDSLAVTRYGYVALAITHCPPGSGDSCVPDPTQYLSTDGLAWTPFKSSVPAQLIVDGPEGVLAIGLPGTVWILR